MPKIAGTGTRDSSAFRPATAVLLMLLALGCGREQNVPNLIELGVSEFEMPLARCESRASLPARIDTLATDLEVPWDAAFLPDGRALVTERPGRIRVVTASGELLAEPWARLDVYDGSGSEVGLMGIAVDPTSAADPSVYVSAVTLDIGSNGVSRALGGIERRIARALDPERGQPWVFEVVRLTERNARGVEETVLVSGLPSGYLHGGGPLRIGPDGFVYTANGDAAEPNWAQNSGTTRGKILRYDRLGSTPADNPIPGSPIYGIGIRHVQGMDWLPSGELLVVDHGPTGLEQEGFRADRDELNIVTAGANLGWPLVTGATLGGGLTSPIAVWTPAIAPAGLAVYAGRDPAWAESVFVTGLRGGSLRRIELERGANGVVARCEHVLFESTYGRLRLVRTAPDGTVWLGTSNRDGRGVPRPGDDLLLRLHPPTTEEGD
jgi:glucose/arabinose dehydrogenase